MQDMANDSTDESMDESESIGESVNSLSDESMDELMEDFVDEDDKDYLTDDYNYLKLWPAVQREFQLGSTMEEAFQNVYRASGRTLMSKSMIHGWLKKFYEEDFDAHDRTNSFHDDLRSAVIGQYLKFTKTMYFSDDWNFIESEAMLNNRFIFVISEAQPKTFSIIDTFTGERRELQGPINKFRTLSPCWPVWIDQTRVLVQFSKRDSLVSLCLLKIDLNEWSVLDTAVCTLKFSRTIVDTMDSSKFLVISALEDNTMIHRGHVKDDRILMDQQKIEIHTALYYIKLEDGKMYAFQQLRNDQHNRDEWHFCEYLIGSGFARNVKNIRSRLRFTNLYEDYAWSKNKLFLAIMTVN